jgi:8-oxo-dGTP pyrophosphatase MutT (NUDIX family)
MIQTAFTTNIVQVHVAKVCEGTGMDRNARIQWDFLALKRSVLETIFPEQWQVVTGSIEPDETPVQTAFRELREETGLVLDELWVLPYVANFFDPVRNIIHFVPCFGGISSTPHIELSEEHDEYAWLSHENLAARLAVPSQAEASRLFLSHILTPISRGESPVFMRCLAEAL